MTQFCSEGFLSGPTFTLFMQGMWERKRDGKFLTHFCEALRFLRSLRASMKRSASDGYGAPQLKRSNSASTDNGDDVEDQAHFHLRSQNRALSLEVRKSKMTIESARKELDMMRHKSREMEALVGTIQRAWSQLDIDTSLLLDSLGDTDVRFYVSLFCHYFPIFVMLTDALYKSFSMHAILSCPGRIFVLHFCTPCLSVCLLSSSPNPIQSNSIHLNSIQISSPFHANSKLANPCTDLLYFAAVVSSRDVGA